MPIGPQLPPHLAQAAGPAPRARSPTPPSEDDDDGFGPALPPELAARRAAGPARPGPSARAGLGSRSPSPVRISAAAAPSSSRPAPGPGPAPSRAPGPARPPPGAHDDSDSDDDDDVIGPMPGAPAVERSAADEFREREARWAAERAGAPKGPVVKRDEWMLMPPTGGALASLDPAKRATAFSRSTTGPAPVDASWTETPAERAARLDDERRGIKRPAPRGAGEDEDPGERKRRKERERDIRAGIEAHSQSTRGPSLLEQHRAKRAEKDDDEPAPIWDHDKMMGVTGRMLSGEERTKKINDARGLNDRFGHGKGGAYSM